jgi:hypothetical protein
MVYDKDMKKIEPGRYQSLIQTALTELSFDTFFNKKRFDYPVPQDLRIELPAGTFSVAEVYAYNGPCDKPQNVQKLWYKQGYFTRGGDTFFAKNRGAAETQDPFYPSGGPLIRDQNTQDLYRRPSVVNNTLFYAVENGILMVSSSTLRFENIHILSHGSICPIGEVPLIPPLFRQAVEDFAVEAATRELLASDPRLYTMYADMNRIYTRRLDLYGYNGSWHLAKQRAKSMSKGQRDDWAEYYSRWSW